jgi:FkbM family methyltransferase
MNSSIKKILKQVTPRRFRSLIEQLRQKKLNLQWNLCSGIKVLVATQADWVIYNDVFVDGEYDIPIVECLHGSNSAECLNILDLGANVGYFGLRFVDLMRRNGYGNLPYSITMIEGAPSLSKELQRRLALADNFSKNITVVHGLVGKREGSGRIHEGAFHPMNSIMQSSPGDVQVKYVDLVKLIGKETQIDLLKCDIEGAELQFIENYIDLLRNVKFAVFEIHPQLCDYDKCIQLLESTGLKQSKVLRQTTGFVVIHFWR